MTKEECAIVTLYTGVSMLEGDDLEYLYKYAEKLMERPVFTHELAALADELKERAKPDFLHLCKWASTQSERLTDDDFETIRIHLSACKERLCNQHRWKEAEEYQRIIDRFMAFASEQPEPEELDFVQPHKKIGVRLEIGQPDRSLWFHIGEICVDESKGFISPGRAVEKIRELLREAERREV